MKYLIEIHGPWTKENKPDYLNKTGTKTGVKPFPREFDSINDAEIAAMKFLDKLKGSDYTVTHS